MNIDEQIRRLTADGWAAITDDGFIGLVGPFFGRDDGAGLRFAFPTADKHHNRRGVLQGGALMTFADRCMGTAARAAAGVDRSATVQLDVQFLDAVEIGELVEMCPVVTRLTRHLMFVRSDLAVADRVVATATGIWRNLGSSTPPGS